MAKEIISGDRINLKQQGVECVKIFEIREIKREDRESVDYIIRGQNVMVGDVREFFAPSQIKKQIAEGRIKEGDILLFEYLREITLKNGRTMNLFRIFRYDNEDEARKDYEAISERYEKEIADLL